MSHGQRRAHCEHSCVSPDYVTLLPLLLLPHDCYVKLKLRGRKRVELVDWSQEAPRGEARERKVTMGQAEDSGAWRAYAYATAERGGVA